MNTYKRIYDNFSELEKIFLREKANEISVEIKKYGKNQIDVVELSKQLFAYILYGDHELLAEHPAVMINFSVLEYRITGWEKKQ